MSQEAWPDAIATFSVDSEEDSGVSSAQLQIEAVSRDTIGSYSFQVTETSLMNEADIFVTLVNV